jgi:GNAT superfamily N-acetyltransferase
MNLQHHPARLADLDLLMQLLKEFCDYDHHPFVPDQVRQATEYLINNPRYGHIWLMTVEGETAGYAVLTLGYSLEYHGIDAFVDEIFLREPYRGLGIGTQTFEFIENEGRQLGVKALHLEVERLNTKARAFYDKVGYQAQDSFLMTKWL